MAEEDLGGPNAVPIGRAAAAAAAALVLQHHHHQQQQQHAVADVKTEPASPSSSEATHTSHTSTLMENGVNGGVYSEDSLDQTDHTDTEDAPLDFSIKRRDRDDGDRDRDRDSGWERERERESGGSPRGAHNLTGSHHHNFTQGDGQTAVNGTPSPALSPVSVTEAGEVHAEHKIGEPQIAFPGMIPGTAIPGLSAAGLMPGFPLGMMPNAGALMGALPFLEQQQRRTSPGGSVSPGGSSSKNTRPFKAYPKDPLSLPLGYHGIASLPGVSPVPNIDVAAAQALTQNSEEMFKQYREYVLKMQTQLRQQRSNNKQNGRINNSRRSSESSGSASPALSQGTSTTNGVIPLTTTTTSSPATSSTPSRKRGRSLPDEQKDEAYWERRRKNNDAAKRSRDTRRAKEDEIAIRAAFLEQENLKLRVELAALKNETAKLRCMLYNS